jgi:hypothetical protein
LRQRWLRLRSLASREELPPPPNLEPADVGIHPDEDESLGRLAAADDVRNAPVVPTPHFRRRNPPFNVNAMDKERLKDVVGSNRWFPSLRRTDNAD